MLDAEIIIITSNPSTKIQKDIDITTTRYYTNYHMTLLRNFSNGLQICCECEAIITIRLTLTVISGEENTTQQQL